MVRVHLVLQATGRAAKVTTVRSSLNTLETLKLNGKLEGIRVEIFFNARMLPNYMCSDIFLILFEKDLPDPCPQIIQLY